MSRLCDTPGRATAASLVALGSLLICAGCLDSRDADETPANQAAAQNTGADEPEQALPQPARPVADDSPTLAGMCRRAATRVGPQLTQYRRQFIRAGLSPPERIALELRPNQASTAFPQTRVVTAYVARKLAEELGHLDGLEVALETPPDSASRAVLLVDTATDFDMPFDAISISVALHLERFPSVTWRDQFSDYGLVYIDGPPTARDLVVSVVGQALRLDFPARTKQWYLLKRGRYTISIRSETGQWRPGSLTTIGSQAIWDISRPAAGPAVATPFSPKAIASDMATFDRAEGSQSRLLVLSPANDARVPRIVTLRGKTEGQGWAGSSVSVTVSTGRETYLQDERSRIGADGTWRIQNVVIGRVGSIDVGASFQIWVQAHRPDGKLIETSIRVTRQ